MRFSPPDPSSIINALPRFFSFEQVTCQDGPALVLPQGVAISYDEKRHRVTTQGLGALDAKQKDLIEVIQINDALTCSHIKTGVLSPRTYVESLQPIPIHAVAAAVLITIPPAGFASEVQQIAKSYEYNRQPYDKFWIGNAIDDETKPQPVIVMNRRIGGWDGSPNRPVIELLGAGGHVPVIWDGEKYESLTAEQTLRREALEEIGLSDPDIRVLGGYYNQMTAELVMLHAIFIKWEMLSALQAVAYGNVEENLDGLYLGFFEETMRHYCADAGCFAGGEGAKLTNFPLQDELMDRARGLIQIRAG